MNQQTIRFSVFLCYRIQTRNQSGWRSLWSSCYRKNGHIASCWTYLPPSAELLFCSGSQTSSCFLEWPWNWVIFWQMWNHRISSSNQDQCGHHGWKVSLFTRTHLQDVHALCSNCPQALFPVSTSSEAIEEKEFCKVLREICYCKQNCHVTISARPRSQWRS